MRKNEKIGAELLVKWTHYIFPDTVGVEMDISGLKEGWAEGMEESIEDEKEKMAKILAIIWRQNFDTIHKFMSGLSKGLSAGGKAKELILNFIKTEKFSENERTAVARILCHEWCQVEKLSNFTEIAELVIEFLPPERAQFLASNANGRRAFEDNLRKLGGAAGLVKAGRGRPKKK
ncbi:hypothetical protein OAM04_00070 [bacterium]|nr:hypothetical protein [bacterium]MDC0322487.1 hypothetical protein [Verrucomicrobiales bacterium]